MIISNKTSVEISVNNLKIGMYVSNLDRSWIETPYLLQGILIQSQEDINELARHCNYVYVDWDKSETFVAPRLVHSKKSVVSQPIANANGKHRTEDAEILKLQSQRTVTYTETRSLKEELPAAKKAFDVASTLLSEISTSVKYNTKLNIQAAHDVVDALRESVVRNPDAALLLARLKTSGQELYDYAINVSVQMLAFGRHLGLPRKELAVLGLGGLLMDIGKSRLPTELQIKNKALLDPSEHKLMKQHVSYGEEIIARSSKIPEEVVKIVTQHHERENGNGYPRGLNASQIHVYARMAAIVDCYEELIVERFGMPALKPFHAFRKLKEDAHNGLNSILVDQFAQCVGMFPVGSLVGLNTGEIAIVLTHNRTNVFLPHVMIILDAKKQPYATPLTLDLRSADPSPDGTQYTIISDLPPGAYGIDAKQYYL